MLVACPAVMAACDPFSASPDVAPRPAQVEVEVEAGAADGGSSPVLSSCSAGAPFDEGFESGALPPAGWSLLGDPTTKGLEVTSAAPIAGAFSLRVLLEPWRGSDNGAVIRRQLTGPCVDVEVSLQTSPEQTPDGLTFLKIEFPNLDQVIGYTSLDGGPRSWKFGEQNAESGGFGSLFQSALPDKGVVRLRVRISGGGAGEPRRQVSVYADGALVGTTPTGHALAGDAMVDLGAIYAAKVVTGEVRLDDVRIR